MNYILQDRNYGLGNFINLTPTIRAMTDSLGHPIPVYFELKFVEQCFLDCPFIEILKEMPPERAMFTSGLVDFRNTMPDYIYVYKEVSMRFDLSPDAPHTYVDECSEIPRRKGKYTLFMYGSGNEDKMYLNIKTPDKSYYEHYMKGECIFTGSVVDFKRVDWFKGMEVQLDDIRKSLALIRDAELIISNDTGLAHAAGAMNKNIIILWKDTMLPKSGNPGKNTLIKLIR